MYFLDADPLALLRGAASDASFGSFAASKDEEKKWSNLLSEVPSTSRSPHHSFPVLRYFLMILMLGVVALR
jgi:hypothetical protein